jgi:hypothetical protein
MGKFNQFPGFLVEPCNIAGVSFQNKDLLMGSPDNPLSKRSSITAPPRIRQSLNTGCMCMGFSPRRRLYPPGRSPLRDGAEPEARWNKIDLFYLRLGRHASHAKLRFSSTSQRIMTRILLGGLPLVYLRPSWRPDLSAPTEKRALVCPVPFAVTVVTEIFFFSRKSLFIYLIHQFNIISATNRTGVPLLFLPRS